MIFNTYESTVENESYSKSKISYSTIMHTCALILIFNLLNLAEIPMIDWDWFRN